MKREQKPKQYRTQAQNVVEGMTIIFLAIPYEVKKVEPRGDLLVFHLDNGRTLRRLKHERVTVVEYPSEK